MGAYRLFQDVKNNKLGIIFPAHLSEVICLRCGALIALLNL